MYKRKAEGESSAKKKKEKTDGDDEAPKTPRATCCGRSRTAADEAGQAAQAREEGVPGQGRGGRQKSGESAASRRAFVFWRAACLDGVIAHLPICEERTPSARPSRDPRAGFTKRRRGRLVLSKNGAAFEHPDIADKAISAVGSRGGADFLV